MDVNNSLTRADNASNDDVFAEYGYANIPTQSVVVQTGDEVIVNNTGLTPPPIDDVSDDEYVEPQPADTAEDIMQEIDTEESIGDIVNTALAVNENEVESGSDDTLPEIPELYDNSDATSRFSGADWYEDVKNITVHIIGVGGIGSMAALAIGRLNPLRLVLQDPDVVEAGNLSGQFYDRNDFDKNKVQALKQKLHSFCDMYYIITKSVAFGETDSFDGGLSSITVCGLDNMQARRNCFNAWRYSLQTIDKDDRKNYLFIDGRLTIDELQIFCIQGDDDNAITKYRTEYLFASSEAMNTVCSRKQTTYCSMLIGGLIANLIVNFVINKNGMAELPFKTYYNTQAMLFKTESSWM